MELPLAFTSTSVVPSTRTALHQQHAIRGPLHAGLGLQNFTIKQRRNVKSTRIPLPSSGTTSLFMSDNSKIDNDSDDEFDFDRRSMLEDLYDNNEFLDEDALMELLALDDDLDHASQEPDFDELKELEQLLEQNMLNEWEDDDEDDEEEEDGDTDDEDDHEDNLLSYKKEEQIRLSELRGTTSVSPSALENALMQGVVPASAGVGSKCLPADYGFDPLGLATKDYYKKVQNFLLNLLPESNGDEEEKSTAGAALPLSTKPFLSDLEERPPALILRDYREIEIRHGRLAMLAAILWPLQEIIDRLFIPYSFGSTTMIYGGVTLPFISLFMTLTMLLLGYLDIYAASIKDQDTGEAFLPGECFWDPLSILEGAPDGMKRNMQARELNNGRFAMIAVLSYILQEGITHQPLILLPWNQVLFEPAFEIPAVQAWLDGQFSGATVTDTGIIDEIWDEILEANDAVPPTDEASSLLL